MAKKAINYDNLTWSDREAEATPPPVVAPEPEEGRGGEAERESQLLKSVAWQTMLYLNFDAIRAIDELALAQSTLRQKVKRHDIICDALDAYLKGHGITVEVRAKPRRHRK